MSQRRVEIIILILTSLMFFVGYLCAQSYQDVLKDWWYMGMYGDMKYLFCDSVILILLYKRFKLAFRIFVWYTLFSIKDLIQYLIDGNIGTLEESTYLFYTGIVLILLFHYLKSRKND